MKVAFICPFDLDRMTGTPTRSRTTIKAAKTFSDTLVIDNQGERLNLFSFLKISTRKLDEYKPDLIHAFTTLSIIPAFIYKLCHPRSVKVIFEMHGWSWFESKGKLNLFARLFLLTVDKIGYIFSEKIIAMSFTQKDFLQNKIFKRKNVEVMWGPVDFDIKFSDLMIRDKIVVGYLGNDNFWQGLSHIIESAKILEKENSDIQFKLAGFNSDDKEKFPIQKNIEYFGKIPNEKVESFIKDCDVMLSPRIKGRVSDLQYPHKLSQYLARGRAVIVSDTNDQRQIVEGGECGVVVDPLNSEKLAEVIVDFSRLPYEKRNEMGKRSAEYAQKNFAFLGFAESLRKVYIG